MNINESKNNGVIKEKEEIETLTIKGILGLLMANTQVNGDKKTIISLGIGDPTAYPCFHTTSLVTKAVVETLQSNNFNGYAPTVGLPQTRKAIAEYLSRDLSEEVSEEDVYVTTGCTQAIETTLSILARPGANILLPKPGFPIYALCASFRNLEIRYYDLLPEQDWEVNLESVEALADQDTIAIVIINPGNPCGNVYSSLHLKNIAETAKKLRCIVIADEVYGHLVFGDTPFIPMASFASIAPVITLGSLSKRYLVPGWRLGWFVLNDPNGVFKNVKFVERLKKYCDLNGGPATFIQAAVPRIIEQTGESFFKKTNNMLKESAHSCCEKVKDIPCITCPYKPQGSMAVMMKLNLSMLQDISDDIDFCFKLAKEENVIFLPGVTVGLKNWIRITFAAEQSSLEEALVRLKFFCQKYSIKKMVND